MAENIIAVKGMSLKGITVYDRDGKEVYPAILTYVQMQECIHMQSGSVYTPDTQIDYYAPFKLVRD